MNGCHMKVVGYIRRRKAIGAENQLRQVADISLLSGKIANVSLSSHAKKKKEEEKDVKYGWRDTEMRESWRENLQLMSGEGSVNKGKQWRKGTVIHGLILISRHCSVAPSTVDPAYRDNLRVSPMDQTYLLTLILLHYLPWQLLGRGG